MLSNLVGRSEHPRLQANILDVLNTAQSVTDHTYILARPNVDGSLILIGDLPVMVTFLKLQ
jgi:hypothetical protein